MEPYIKDNVSDITYQSELIPAASYFFALRKSTAGINSHR